MIQETPELRDHKDFQELMEPMVQMERREPKAIQVIQGRKDP